MKLLFTWTLRILGVFISIFGIAKGILSDGIFGWGLLALPFILLLCVSLPMSQKKRTVLFAIMAIIVAGGWELKHYSSFFYEPIGQTVTLTEDIPVFRFHRFGGWHFDLDPKGEIQCLGPSCPEKIQTVIPKGTVFKVRNINTYVIDFGRDFEFVLKSDAYKLSVDPFHVLPYSEDRPFCKYVDWELCKRTGMGIMKKEPFHSFSQFIYRVPTFN